MQHDPFTHPDDQSEQQSEKLEVVCANDCNAEPVEWLWPEKIPIGKVTLLIGDPGTGKSLVALDIAARASRLAPWPDDPVEGRGTRVESQNLESGPRPSTLDPRPPGSVILLSATDDLADTIRPRLDATGADPHRIFVIPSLADLRDDFDQLRAAVDRAPNCRLIIIDPINAYVGPSDTHFQTVLRKILTPLAKLATKRRIAVLAVAHLRKSDGAAIYRAAGSMGFVAAARAVWTVCRDQDNPGRFMMLPIKNNLGPAACGLAYSIESRGQHGAAAISWHAAPITTSADEALRRPEATDLNAARQWLRQVLALGPRSASDVTQEAAHHGFHERTLRRALHAIGGNTQNRGLLEGWWWSIPDTTNDELVASNGLVASPGLSLSKSATSSTKRPHALTDDNPSLVPSPAPSPRPLTPQSPVRLCPLPEISNEPPVLDPSPEQPSVSEFIVFLNRLDRLPRTGRFSDQFPNRPKQKPNVRPQKTGNPILDRLLDSLRQPMPIDQQNFQPTPPDSS